MDEKNCELLNKVLFRLEEADLLDGMILIGSWALLFYEDYLSPTPFRATIRTRDLDILIPMPPCFSEHHDLQELFEELGFILVHRGREGFITFQHPELIIEFLAPMRGRGRDKPIAVPTLGINAQPLRFLDMLCTDPVKATVGGVEATVAHPVRFALHKLLIAPRRQDRPKGDKDRTQALAVLQSLLKADQAFQIREVYGSLPKGWRRTILKELQGLKDEVLLNLLAPITDE